MSLLKVRLTLFFSLLSMVLALGGCNTMEGAGQDLKAAGKGIERSADREKNY